MNKVLLISFGLFLVGCENGQCPADAAANDAPNNNDMAASEGGASEATHSPYSPADVVWMTMSFPTTMDGSVPVTLVKVQRSGDATCSKSDWLGAKWTGTLAAVDTTIPDLLARPGLVGDLVTSCPLGVSDAGPTITTRFANDAEPMVHTRLVMGSCANANLVALVQALERIGDACIATATYVAGPDGGMPLGGG